MSTDFFIFFSNNFPLRITYIYGILKTRHLLCVSTNYRRVFSYNLRSRAFRAPCFRESAFPVLTSGLLHSSFPGLYKVVIVISISTVLNTAITAVLAAARLTIFPGWA
jgi:hypothetical protein